MAKKASRKKAARAKVPSGMTTLIVGEEGGHPTTLALGEEIIRPHWHSARKYIRPR